MMYQHLSIVTMQELIPRQHSNGVDNPMELILVQMEKEFC